MIRTLCQRPVDMKNQISICYFELACDSVSDLPDPTNFDGRIIDMGSIAWVINTSEIYGLNSSGEWVLQKVTE